MARVASILLILLFLGLLVKAANPLSAASRYQLWQRNATCLRGVASSSPRCYQAFIGLNDDQVIDSLQAVGVKINATFNGFVTATIPAHVMHNVVSIEGVSQISLGCHVHVCNDSARYYSNVDDLIHAKGMPAPLRGKDVIVGIIDTGIDYNHVNWNDADGRSRLQAVYMPCDSSGVSPVVDGYSLPGSYYETQGEIALLTTDSPDSSHGTHTAGTAVGGYMSCNWYGVAPEADIVACGIPEDELTDINIANCLRYIFDFADRAGKPCVVNMSLGTNDGPNDGSSFLCRTFSSLSGPGRICVLSAGNDGNAPICFHENLSGNRDTVTTLLRNQWSGLQRKGYVSMWNDGAQEHLTRIVIVNRQTGEIEYASSWIGSLPEDSVYEINSVDDLDFGAYYSGYFQYVNAIEPQFDVDGSVVGDGRFHSYWIFDATSLAAGHLVGIQYTANQPTMLSGWCTKNTYFYSFNLPGVTGGTSQGSISDMATTDDVISVGAYCTRASYVNIYGDNMHITGSIPTDIADFSSYGPDERGLSRPDICAPGYSVISSASRYETDAVLRSWVSPVTVDGIEYPYYVNQGTSMSAPVVSGCIALLLQLEPRLTVGMIRDVFNATAVRDQWVQNGNLERWGSGKIDVLAAVNHVIDRILLKGDVNHDDEVNIADVLLIIDVLLDDGSQRDSATLIRADVNRDSEIQIADVNRLIDLILKN